MTGVEKLTGPLVIGYDRLLVSIHRPKISIIIIIIIIIIINPQEGA